MYDYIFVDYTLFLQSLSETDLSQLLDILHSPSIGTLFNISLYPGYDRETLLDDLYSKLDIGIDMFFEEYQYNYIPTDEAYSPSDIEMSLIHSICQVYISTIVAFYATLSTSCNITHFNTHFTNQRDLFMVYHVHYT